jgi:hypothetical protein
MRNFSFYEHIPGAIFVIGLIIILPELRSFFQQDGVSIGDLGAILLVAYAAGQGIAALGNVIESAWWKVQGGMPSCWVVGEEPRILHPAQVKQLEGHISERLKIPSLKLQAMGRRE